MNKNNNKQKTLGTLLALCIICAMASPLMADMTVRLDGYGDLRTGTGGEFSFITKDGWPGDFLDHYDDKVKQSNINGGETIQSFCLEENEYLWSYKTYYVDISSSARYGGNGGFDTISEGSAWLYKEFAAGDLTGYTYDPGTNRKNSGKALQQAIWYLENEISKPSYNQFLDLLTTEGGFASLTEAMADYTGNEVAVMRLWKDPSRSYSSRAQDQIMLNPTPVPAPGALTLAGIGALITGYRKRKHVA